MSLTVQLAPLADVPDVRYQWDPDTDILSAVVDASAPPDAGFERQAVREALDACAVREDAPVALASRPPAAGPVVDDVGPSGAIEVEGTDGSWLSLEIVRGRIAGVQVAVWPTVRRRSALAAPPAPPCAAFASGRRPSPTDRPVALELSARVAAETDRTERVFHFLFGPPRATERARIARDIVLEVDARQRLAGLWLLNVPPFPHDT